MSGYSVMQYGSNQNVLIVVVFRAQKARTSPPPDFCFRTFLPLPSRWSPGLTHPRASTRLVLLLQHT